MDVYYRMGRILVFPCVPSPIPSGNIPVTEQNPKPFILFGGYNYYPRGGMNDYIESFETREAAEDYVKENNYTRDTYSYHGRTWDWHHIVDIRQWMNDNTERESLDSE